MSAEIKTITAAETTQTQATQATQTQATQATQTTDPVQAAMAALMAKLSAAAAADKDSERTEDGTILDLVPIEREAEDARDESGRPVRGIKTTRWVRFVVRVSGTNARYTFICNIARFREAVPAFLMGIDYQSPNAVREAAIWLKGAAITYRVAHHAANSVYAKWSKTAAGQRIQVAAHAANANDLVDVLAIIPTAEATRRGERRYMGE